MINTCDGVSHVCSNKIAVYKHGLLSWNCVKARQRENIYNRVLIYCYFCMNRDLLPGLERSGEGRDTLCASNSGSNRSPVSINFKKLMLYLHCGEEQWECILQRRDFEGRMTANSWVTPLIRWVKLLSQWDRTDGGFQVNYWSLKYVMCLQIENKYKCITTYIGFMFQNAWNQGQSVIWHIYSKFQCKTRICSDAMWVITVCFQCNVAVYGNLLLWLTEYILSKSVEVTFWEKHKSRWRSSKELLSEDVFYL